MTTVAEVKFKLSAAIYAQRRLERNVERLQVLRSQVERITPVISAMPKGGGELDRRGKLLAELIDISREYEADCVIQQRVILDTLKLIDMLSDDFHREILEYHYVQGMDWQPIAEKTGYAYSTVTNAHGIALRELARKLSEKK